jgi:hypothetical protein
MWTVVTLDQALSQSEMFVDQKEDAAQPVSPQGHVCLETLLQRPLTLSQVTTLMWWDVLVRSLVKSVFVASFEALPEDIKHAFPKRKRDMTDPLWEPLHYDVAEDPAPESLRDVPFTKETCSAVIAAGLPFPFEFIWHYEMVVEVEQAYENREDVLKDLTHAGVYIKDGSVLKRKTIKTFIRL